MKKLMTFLVIITTLFLVGCMDKAESILKGAYQSEQQDNGYVVQMSFQDDDKSFVQYIDNREIDRGTYEKLDINLYEIKSNQQNYKVEMDGKGNYDIVIEKINEGKPFEMKHIQDVPVYFSEEFGDEEEYESILSDN